VTAGVNPHHHPARSGGPTSDLLSVLSLTPRTASGAEAEVAIDRRRCSVLHPRARFRVDPGVGDRTFGPACFAIGTAALLGLSSRRCHKGPASHGGGLASTELRPRAPRSRRCRSGSWLQARRRRYREVNTAGWRPCVQGQAAAQAAHRTPPETMSNSPLPTEPAPTHPREGPRSTREAAWTPTTTTGRATAAQHLTPSCGTLRRMHIDKWRSTNDHSSE
jgi:hypothetical protein